MLGRSTPTYRALRRAALVALGAFFVLVGLIGLVMPVMPTSPFLILALACFARASDRLHGWLRHQRQIGDVAAWLRGARNPVLRIASRLLDWALDLNKT